MIEDGQDYYNEPVRIPDNSVKQSIKKALKLPFRKEKVIGYNRVKLNWLKPGPDGELVPR